MAYVSHDSETLAKGQQVITACVFIHKEIDGVEKVLLAKRALTKKFLPGVYELPGGHIEFGEDVVSGLKREVREELNMDIEVGDPFFVFTYKNDIKLSHSIEVIYFARFVDDGHEPTINLDDHSGYGWFAEDELSDATNELKGLDDDEFKGVYKGFSILKGEPLAY